MKKFVALAAGILVLASCIKNDIPYPRLEGSIESLTVASSKSVLIDKATRRIEAVLYDTCNLAKVRVTDFTLSEGASAVDPIIGTHNCMLPVTFRLATHPGQFYDWTFTATAPVERYFNVEGQLGPAQFNVGEKHVVVNVPLEADLEHINVLGAKLAPIGSVITPDPLEVHDYRHVVVFKVTYKGVTEEWDVNIVPKAASVVTKPADPWARLAYFYGTYHESLGAPCFRYRESGTSEWTYVKKDIEIEGTEFSAYVPGLKADTEYEYSAVAISGAGVETAGSPSKFTTEEDLQMENMSFDDWCMPNNTWYPNATEDTLKAWWDTGNYATMMFGENATLPESEFVVSGKAVHMKTIKVLIALAGGNVFNGRFVKVQGVGAQVDFGQPWYTRPTQLKGYYQYTPKVISGAKGEWAEYNGRMDRLHIFIVMAEWDGHFRVDTGASPQIHIDPEDPAIIAYASLVDSVGTGPAYKEFTLDIPYRDHRKPTCCAVVACGSEFADYLVGGVGSEGYVDEFSLVYDTKPVFVKK